jgi:hypothetical protein
MAPVCADEEAAGGGPGCGKAADHLKPLIRLSARLLIMSANAKQA